MPVWLGSDAARMLVAVTALRCCAAFSRYDVASVAPVSMLRPLRRCCVTPKRKERPEGRSLFCSSLWCSAVTPPLSGHALHPETKHGVVGNGREKSRQLDDSTLRFTSDTAAKIGRSESRVQKDARPVISIEILL